MNFIFHTLWGVKAGIILLRSGILAAVPRDSVSGLQWKLVQIIRTFEKPNGNAAAAFASLGPSFIKFGQFLASRSDIVGVNLAQDLSKLQDEMPPFSQTQAIAIVELETGKPLAQTFSDFSQPIAAASVAQVHKATLINGKIVAVKLLRPDIRARFKQDLARMAFGAKFAEMFSGEARRLKMRGIVQQFEGWARAEMDLRIEAAAISEIQELTKNDANFRTPHVFWDYSTREMLTMEWVEGISLKDIGALKTANIDCEKLGAHLLQSFLKHALNNGFFHADMHAGNLFASISSPHPSARAQRGIDTEIQKTIVLDPRVKPEDEDVSASIIAVDFGIMGRLGDKERRFFAEILWGFIRRDYERIAQVHFDAGYVPRSQDKAAFAQALRAVGEPIHERPAAEISMARVITLLFEITSIYGMETRLELLLLQKSMVMVEGLARTLNPNINIWSTSEPIVKTWIENEIGPKAATKHLAKAASSLARHLPNLDIILENLTNPPALMPAEPKVGGSQKPRLMPYMWGGIAGFIVALAFFTILR